MLAFVMAEFKTKWNKILWFLSFYHFLHYVTAGHGQNVNKRD